MRRSTKVKGEQNKEANKNNIKNQNYPFKLFIHRQHIQLLVKDHLIHIKYIDDNKYKLSVRTV